MSRVVKYVPASGGDFNAYYLSDGRIMYAWWKYPFLGGEVAVAELYGRDSFESNDYLLGTIQITKSCEGLNECYVDLEMLEKDNKSEPIRFKITWNQYWKPNKKYYLDKVISIFK